MSPSKRKPNGKGLTISKDKVGVLLRLPKAAVSVLDKVAKQRKMTRTAVLYEVIGAHKLLSKHMQAAA